MIAGVFVGGASRRMGGRAKGLLVGPAGETLVARWASLFERLGLPAVLVGERADYAAEALPSIPDRGTDLGPLGGLLALLEHAASGSVIAVACDMPYVSDALVRRLVESPPAPAVAARRDGRWEPFLARYDVARARPIAEQQAKLGKRSLQALLDAVGATELPLSPDEHAELRDWDTPEDVSR